MSNGLPTGSFTGLSGTITFPSKCAAIVRVIGIAPRKSFVPGHCITLQAPGLTSTCATAGSSIFCSANRDLPLPSAAHGCYDTFCCLIKTPDVKVGCLPPALVGETQLSRTQPSANQEVWLFPVSPTGIVLPRTLSERSTCTTESHSRSCFGCS